MPSRERPASAPDMSPINTVWAKSFRYGNLLPARYALCWLGALLISFSLPVVAGSVASVNPAPGSTVTNLTQVTVTFTNTVLGVQPEDLMLNGAFSTAVSGSGTVYTYSFDPPSPGSVQASWNGANTITDLHTNRLDDLSTNTWQYTLLDVVPPAVTNLSPVAGATVKQLTQIVVNFSESVTGVNASDLTVNNKTATSLSGSGAGPYTFYFNAPSPGPVQAKWAGSPGIADLAGNPFPGGGTSWSYTVDPSDLAGDVIINEFLALNANTNSGLRDEDGTLQSWIELYNRGTNTINLLGWGLTTDPTVPNAWTFPATNLAPGRYMVVFADAKNRKPTNGTPCHTSFMLGTSGQYLGLFDASQPPAVAAQFTPNYPIQQADVSYGLSGTNFTYMTPTPGATNSAGIAFSGVASAPAASVQSGFFNQSFTLSLSTATPGANIRYTTDNSDPGTANGTLYTGPITVSGSSNAPCVNVRAIALRSDLLASPIATLSYIFPSAVLQQPLIPTGFPSTWVTIATNVYPADYQMDPKVLTNGTYATMALQALANLPAVSIVLNNADLFSQQSGLYANPFPPIAQRPQWERRTSAELIMPDGSKGWQLNAGLRTQGGTSRNPGQTGKHSLRLFFNNTYDGNLNASVFDDSPRNSFNTLILDSGANYKWHCKTATASDDAYDQLIRDEYCSALQIASGSPCWHSRWVNLFLNGLYWGTYYLHERTDDNWAASYYGGNASDYDCMRNTSDGLEVVSGSGTAWTNMMALVNSGLNNNAQYDQLKQYLDVDQFIDYMIVNFWTGNTDWANHNWYANRLRTPGAGFKFQVWDAEFTMISSTVNNTTYNQVQSPTAIHSSLFINNGEYRLRFADHVQRLFFNGGPFYVNSNNPTVNPAQPSNNVPGALYLQHEAVIDLAAVLESARWGDSNPARTNNPFTRNVEFLNELNRLKTNYFIVRSSNVLNQFRANSLFPSPSGILAPTLNQFGGSVPAGFNLTMAAPVGTIYYTTNGADPHVYNNTNVDPGALIYTNGMPLVLNRSMTVMARARSGTTATASWSPLTQASFSIAEPLVPMAFTEINYNPPGGSQYEFFEMKNISSAAVDLSGHSFSGVTFVFPPGSTVAPGSLMVLACGDNPSIWTNQYHYTPFGYYSGHLSNSGETLALKDPAGDAVISVTYWPAPTNGWPDASHGASLEINDVYGDPNDPANWRASSVTNGIAGGTPGTLSAPPATGAVRLNEIMAQNNSVLTNGGTTPDWIELANISNSAVSLAGWSLSNDSNPRKYIIPTGTNIAANGYLLVFCDSQTGAPGMHTGFTLNSTNGETIFLYDNKTNRVDAISFGPQVPNLSVGRINNAWQLNQPTPRATNQPASLGTSSSLSINEWMASAPPGGSDWFELYNPSSLPVALKGLYVGTSNHVFQMTSLSFVSPAGFVQLIADAQPGANHVDFHLAAAGDSITLYDPFGNALDGVSFGQQSDGVSQGRLPDGDANIIFFPGSASPGAPNYAVSAGGGTGVRLNEIMARNDSAVVDPWGGYSDWIELYNPGTSATNLSGMSLSVNGLSPGQWAFPAGSTIPARGYLVLWCSDHQPATTNLQANLNVGRPLDGNNGSVYFFNATNQVLDYVQWGFQLTNQPIGRISTNWVLLATNTPGATNSAAAALGAASSLRINEWMAAPSSGSGWFELYNSDALPVSLGGLYLTDDPSLAGATQFQIAPLSFISGQGWVKWNADGSPSSGPNHLNFQLDAAGDSILIYNTSLALVDAIYFATQQTGVSQGRLPDGTGTIVSFPSSASPGDANFLPLTNAVINEVLTRTNSTTEDAIELANLTGASVNIGGWYLSDSDSQPKKYRIPTGTNLPPNGFVVFYQNQFNASPGTSNSFVLDPVHGGSVYLSEADGSGNLTGYRTSASFGAGETNLSFGRYLTSTGTDFVAMSQHTFGMDNPANVSQFRTGTGLTNAYPKVGPVVINEIMYNPVTVVSNTLVENQDYEFIELQNITSNAVSLFDTGYPTNTWRLDGGVSFSFPTGVVMAANSYLVLVNFDPATNATLLAGFGSLYGIPTNNSIFGPYQGHLNNSGDQVKLYKPDHPSSAPSAGFVPFILVDNVDYLPTTPWPVGAAGGGASLQRLSRSAYGNDPTNWKADLATPDATNAPSSGPTPPVITTQPQSQTVLQGSNVVFAISATGNPAPVCQWQHEGTNLPGANGFTLSLSNAQPAQSGTYQAWVTNNNGSIYSQPATLSVLAAPVITIDPASQSVPWGSNFTLQVTVTGTAPLFYQWYFNASLVFGATNASLVVNNPDQSASGNYQILITNVAGQATSHVAVINVVAVDSDGDGIPDWWMNLHFGHPTGQASDLSRAQDDPDGDGMSNLKEYLSGTDPFDPASCLKLFVGTGGSSLQFQFTAEPGLSYTVQSRTNLAAGSWGKSMDVSSYPTARQITFTPSGPTNGPALFYRVVTPLQP